MSNQGEDGWYPECEKCKCGNLQSVICCDCVKKEIENSLAYHKGQLKLNQEIGVQIVAHHHEIIIDFIENELKERLRVE